MLYCYGIRVYEKLFKCVQELRRGVMLPFECVPRDKFIAYYGETELEGRNVFVRGVGMVKSMTTQPNSLSVTNFQRLERFTLKSITHVYVTEGEMKFMRETVVRRLRVASE